MKTKVGLHIDPFGEVLGYTIKYQPTENDPWTLYPMLVPGDQDVFALFIAQAIANGGLQALDVEGFPPWTYAQYEGPGGVT